MTETLRIAEIFASIQGEGSWLGTPSTFVRVSGCNLRCIWCDTPYASWDPEGPIMQVDDIVAKVRSLDVRHVVLTGGEPMLFDAIEPLARKLRELGHLITIETAGTVFRALSCDLMSISPKLSNSTPPADSGWSERHDATRLNSTVITKLVSTYPFQLKFVVGDAPLADLVEIESLIDQLPGVDPGSVFLMAEGRDVETLHKRQPALVEICMDRGWRLTPRLQIELFGDTRGT